MLTLESRLCRADGILKQQAADSLVLFNREEGQYYALDEVGARAWELCDGTRPLAAVVAVLVEEYDAPPETIAADLLELMEDLAQEGLVLPAPSRHHPPR